MKFESLDVITHEHAESLEREGDAVALSRAVLSLALSDGDVEWTTTFLLKLATHENANVRGNALLGLGHLTRRFKALPQAESVARALQAGLVDQDAFVRGQADAAVDDVEKFAASTK